MQMGIRFTPLTLTLILTLPDIYMLHRCLLIKNVIDSVVTLKTVLIDINHRLSFNERKDKIKLNRPKISRFQSDSGTSS